MPLLSLPFSGGWPSESEVGWGTAVRRFDPRKEPTPILPEVGEGSIMFIANTEKMFNFISLRKD